MKEGREGGREGHATSKRTDTLHRLLKFKRKYYVFKFAVLAYKPLGLAQLEITKEHD